MPRSSLKSSASERFERFAAKNITLPPGEELRPPRARLVATPGMLDLHDVGAEPAEDLRAASARRATRSGRRRGSRAAARSSSRPRLPIGSRAKIALRVAANLEQMKLGMNMLLWSTDVTGPSTTPIFEHAARRSATTGIEVPIFDQRGRRSYERARASGSTSWGSTALGVGARSDDDSPISADPACASEGCRRRTRPSTRARRSVRRTLCGPLDAPLGVLQRRRPDRRRSGSASVEGLRAAAEHAATRDVTIVVEYLNRFEMYLINCAADAAALVREVDHPNCRLMYDTFHAHIEEKDPRAALQACADVLVHVHAPRTTAARPAAARWTWDDDLRRPRRDRLRRLDRDRGVRRLAARARRPRRRSGGGCSRARSSSRATAPPSSATAGAASRPSVHVTGPVPQRIESELRESFELVDAPAGADGILALLTTTVDGDYLDAAGPQLRVVANYGVGVDNIDLEAARSRSVLIANTPDVLTEATAELAIGLTLALLRRIAEGDRMLRTRHTWRFSLEFMLGESLRGKRFGIVGAGRIGTEVARLAEAHGAIPVLSGRGDDLGALLDVADVVSLHCPLTPDTRHLVDAAAFERMKDDGRARQHGARCDRRRDGPVTALEAGSIAGAALDVYEHEPDVPPGLLNAGERRPERRTSVARPGRRARTWGSWQCTPCARCWSRSAGRRIRSCDAHRPLRDVHRRHAVPGDRRATVELLERLGHEVVFPEEQTCCGQMHRTAATATRRSKARPSASPRSSAATTRSCRRRSSCVGTVREMLGMAPRLRAVGAAREAARRRRRRSFVPAPRRLPPDLSLAARDAAWATHRLRLLRQRARARARAARPRGGMLRLRRHVRRQERRRRRPRSSPTSATRSRRPAREFCTAVDGSCLLQIGGGLARRRPVSAPCTSPRSSRRPVQLSIPAFPESARRRAAERPAAHEPARARRTRSSSSAPGRRGAAGLGGAARGGQGDQGRRARPPRRVPRAVRVGGDRRPAATSTGHATRPRRVRSSPRSHAHTASTRS